MGNFSLNKNTHSRVSLIQNKNHQYMNILLLKWNEELGVPVVFDTTWLWY